MASDAVTWLFTDESGEELHIPVTDLERVLSNISSIDDVNSENKITQGGVIKREYLAHDIVTIVGMFDNNHIPDYANYEKGARYFNATDGMLYLRWASGWVQPTEPEADRLFVNLSDNRVYRFWNRMMVDVSETDLNKIRVKTEDGDSRIATGGVIKREHLSHDIMPIIGIFDNEHIPNYADYDKGARYFNSTNGKLYLRWTSGWIQPVIPEIDRMFVNKSDNKLYRYFDNTLVDVNVTDVDRIMAKITNAESISDSNRIAQGGVIKREYIMHDIMTIIGIFDNDHIPSYTEYDKGARYFNSTDGKLYLRWTDGWIQPITPDVERMFVSLSDGKLYRYYDGTLIEVGAGDDEDYEFELITD